MELNKCLPFVVFSILTICLCQSGADNGGNGNAIKTAAEATYTPEEVVALEKFKKSIEENTDISEPYMRRDEYLITWLRAKNLNIDQAKTMLLKNVQWRKTENIDGLLTEEFPQFTKGLPYDLQSVDKEGRPLLIVNFVKWDIRKIVLAGQLKTLLRYMNKVLFEETSTLARVAGQVSGNNSTQWYVLADMAGYSLRQHACLQCLRIFFFYIEIYENYYPQLVKETVLINTPKIFDSIITSTKSLWSTQLTDHVSFPGFDRKEWTRIFGEMIALDQLPVRFGGTNPRKV